MRFFSTSSSQNANTPPVGSLPESYQNATHDAYQAGLKFEKQYPPPTAKEISQSDISTIASKGHAAWAFENAYIDGITVEGPFTVAFSGKGDRSCLASLPLHIDPTHPERPYCYFEATIDSIVYGEETPVVSVGVATKPYPQFRLVGWNRFSIGYHSDDGRLFQDDGFGGKFFASPYSKDDTVGVGYDSKRGIVFFTVNGTYLNSIPTGQHPYHAAIGSDAQCRITVNVGQALFKYSDANPRLPSYDSKPSLSSSVRVDPLPKSSTEPLLRATMQMPVPGDSSNTGRSTDPGVSHLPPVYPASLSTVAPAQNEPMARSSIEPLLPATLAMPIPAVPLGGNLESGYMPVQSGNSGAYDRPPAYPPSR